MITTRLRWTTPQLFATVVGTLLVLGSCSDKDTSTGALEPGVNSGAGGSGSPASGGSVNATPPISGGPGSAGVANVPVGNAGGATSAGGSGDVTAAGGTQGVGGQLGAGGVSSGGAPNQPPITPIPGGTPTRPVLSDADATNFEILDYLARAGSVVAPVVDNWDPTAGVDLAAIPATGPTMVVASGGSIQAAIDAAVGPTRTYIELMPGTYRETVCVPNGAPPITLYSNSADASTTIVIFDNLAGRSTVAGTVVPNACATPGAATFGADASATFAVYGREFQAKNFTIANDADEAEAAATGNTQTQALALQTRGDRAIFDNVRFLGHQDTLQFKTPNADTISRAYAKNCYVEGDVDFVYGRGTAVLDNCEIRSVLTRTGEVRTGGNVLAPSTDARNPYGILVINSTFTTDSAGPSSFTLGRAWDEGQILAPSATDPTRLTYAQNIAAGTYPNGQAVVRNSTFGAHINAIAPWASAATTARPFSSTDGTYPANRLFEYADTP